MMDGSVHGVIFAPLFLLTVGTICRPYFSVVALW